MEQQRREGSCILSFPVVRFRGFGDERERLLKWGFEELGLTRQECRIALMILKGSGNEAICGELYITRNTLKFHIRNVNRKLGIRNREELFALSLRLTRPQEGAARGRGKVICLSEAAAFYRQRCREES